MLNEFYVRAFVARGSGLATKRVRPGNQNAPWPDELNATVLRITDRAEGRAIPRDEDDGDTIANHQHRIARYSIQFFGKGAVAAADRFVAWAESDEGILAAQGALRDSVPEGQKLWPDGTRMGVILPLDPVMRLDGIIDEKWEERTQVNMECRYISAFRHSDRAPERVPMTILQGDVTVLDAIIERPQ